MSQELPQIPPPLEQVCIVHLAGKYSNKGQKIISVTYYNKYWGQVLINILISASAIYVFPLSLSRSVLFFQAWRASLVFRAKNKQTYQRRHDETWGRGQKSKEAVVRKSTIMNRIRSGWGDEGTGVGPQRCTDPSGHPFIHPPSLFHSASAVILQGQWLLLKEKYWQGRAVEHERRWPTIWLSSLPNAVIAGWRGRQAAQRETIFSSSRSRALL